jgi:hypothetical protein
MTSASTILTAIQRSAHHARQLSPFDSTRRLEIFVTALAGALELPLIGDRVLGDMVFNLRIDTLTALEQAPARTEGE